MDGHCHKSKKQQTKKKMIQIILKKTFFKLMNNAVFGKIMKNVRKHSDCKPVTTEGRRNYLVSEPKYYKIKLFFRKILMNKLAY